MEIFNEIFEICDRIKDNFLILEEETLAILSCDADEIEEHTIKRAEMLEMNKKLYDEIFGFCEKSENGDSLSKAVKNTALRNELSEDEKIVFDRFSEVYAVVNRVVNVDKQVVDRIEREQQKIVEKIKQMNASTESKATKYFSASQTGEEKHFSDNVRRV